MSDSKFSFKQFDLHQELCAMKVGTDGVLLGAWTDVSSSQQILDIGTGTGLIALMLAQRNVTAHITAIDIDEAAVEQAKENIAASPWKNRIEVRQQDVCNFSSNRLFDTIVSNPPYFNQSLKGPDSQRNTARHTDSLDSSDLFKKVAEILHPEGRFSIIIPSDQTDEIIRIAATYGLHPSRQTDVITRPGLPPKRALLAFQKAEEICFKDELVIELERHVYSEDYIALTRDFYLKM